MTTDQYDEVLTHYGRRLHFSEPGDPLTLCDQAVAQRRAGGSWVPERRRVIDHWQTCLRCRNKVAPD